MPRRNRMKEDRAVPVVRPLAYEYWGEAHTRGKAPTLDSHNGEAKPSLTSAGTAAAKHLEAPRQALVVITNQPLSNATWLVAAVAFDGYVPGSLDSAADWFECGEGEASANS